jgi:putative oxidoreductase
VQLIRTLLRVLVGGLFIGHGTQKVFGWFGGYGPEGTGQFFDSIGLRPGKRNAIVAGTAETTGGTLLALGLLTPVAGTLITAVMSQAIRSLKMDKGPFAQNEGWELEAVLAFAALGFVDAGPGPLSLDHALGMEHSGTGWALAALAAGIAGPMLVAGSPAPSGDVPAGDAAGAPSSG